MYDGMYDDMYDDKKCSHSIIDNNDLLDNYFKLNELL